MSYGSLLDDAFDLPEVRKGRGAFFTPSALSDFIVRWAIRSGSERVLEPSCGEGEFLLAAARRIGKLCVGKPVESELVGYEIHEASARQARRRLRDVGMSCTVKIRDFLAEEAHGGFDVVVGNPPYVRFQELDEDQRAVCRVLSERSGVRISALSSLWVPFVVQSALFLDAGGRMGLVLPSELLTVNYAAPIRRFLMSSFAYLQLVTFERRVFPEVQEDVVLLLAEGYRLGAADKIEWRQCCDADDMAKVATVDYMPGSGDARWGDLFASPDALRSQGHLLDEGTFVPLSEWGRVSLGAVTGNNGFFALTEQTVDDFGLGEGDCVDLCPPGSRHMRGAAFTSADLARLRRNGARTRLFYPSSGVLSSAARAYIEWGESQGIDKAYKCRVRSPWWRVPLCAPPDAFVTYMNAFGPSVCANKAGVSSLNSCHGLYFNDSCRAAISELFSVACLNSATFFGAEIVGRAYGGGMLKLEPSEAARLPVPSLGLVERAAADLRSVEPSVKRCLGRSDYAAALSIVDGVLASKIDAGETLECMAESAGVMRARRKNRSGRKESGRVRFVQRV